jgi:hypothetical protein
VTTATKESLSVGDSVYLRYDPARERGVILSATVNESQWYVAWDSGKTWIYHTGDLVLAES